MVECDEPLSNLGCGQRLIQDGLGCHGRIHGVVCHQARSQAHLWTNVVGEAFFCPRWLLGNQFDQHLSTTTAAAPFHDDELSFSISCKCFREIH